MQWLYVGAVAAGLGAGIATGQGVAAATEVEPLVDTLSAMLLGDRVLCRIHRHAAGYAP